ncbi:MAG: hypothetical protein GF387_00505 [Candidatus Portnoybacteria bacterium]|nr:hypothetical protein [Candidatus Portnoybacteria bacterium]
MTDKRKRAISGRFNEGYTTDEIRQAIDNYANILKDDKYYFKHKWILEDFLQRGFEKFLDKRIAESNYKKDNSEEEDKLLAKNF